MTEALTALFDKNYRNDTTITHENRVMYCDPRTIYEPDRLKMYDKWSADNIERLTVELALLKDYRAAIVERFGELLTAATVPVIRLKRHKDSYTNKVFYYLEEITRYLDEPNTQNRVKTPYTDRIDNSTKYEGKARREALQAFEAYKKAHPGIIAILDIERASWEH